MFDLLSQYLFSFLACFLFLKVCRTGCFPGRFFGLEAFSVLKDFRRYMVDGFFKGKFLEFAFPDDNNRTTFCFKPTPDFLVPFLVTSDFGRPEVGVGLGDCVELAGFVAVPEAAVDEDYCPVFWKDDIGGAWETFVVHSVAETFLPKGMAQPQLRFCGCGVDGGHVVMALGESFVIRHAFYEQYKNTPFHLYYCNKIIKFARNTISHISMKEAINRIKVVLADKNKTNKWLAEQLGKDPATVSKWCTNTSQPGVETLIDIARLLEVEVGDLLRVPKPVKE